MGVNDMMGEVDLEPRKESEMAESIEQRRWHWNAMHPEYIAVTGWDQGA